MWNTMYYKILDSLLHFPLVLSLFPNFMFVCIHTPVEILLDLISFNLDVYNK